MRYLNNQERRATERRRGDGGREERGMDLEEGELLVESAKGAKGGNELNISTGN